jgi:hypothetical protein
MQGTDVLHDSLLKNFQNLKELRHFSRKQNFWPEKAKHTPCLLKIAPLCVFRRAAILRNRKAASLIEGNRAAPILWPQRDFEWYLPRFFLKI